MAKAKRAKPLSRESTTNRKKRQEVARELQRAKRLEQRIVTLSRQLGVAIGRSDEILQGLERRLRARNALVNQILDDAHDPEPAARPTEPAGQSQDLKQPGAKAIDYLAEV